MSKVKITYVNQDDETFTYNGETYKNTALGERGSAIAINAGTNLPSVATPNGQAAFLFLLTSPIAALIKLPYLRMMYMAIPYTIVLTIIGLIATWFIMPIATGYMISEGLVHGASIEAILGQMK